MIERPVCLCLKIGSWLQFFNKGRLLAALDSHKMPRQSAGNKANYAFGASNHCPTKAVARPCNTLIICRYSLAPTPVSPEIYKVNIVQDMSSPPLSKSHRGRCPIRYDLTQIEVKNESKVSKLVFKYLLNCDQMPFILPTDLIHYSFFPRRTRSRTYQWYFSVNNIDTPGPLNVDFELKDCGQCDKETFSMTLPVNTLSNGIVCRYMPGAGNFMEETPLGDLNMPPLNGESCNQGLVVASKPDGEKVCVSVCETDQECPVQPLLSCQNGKCMISDPSAIW